MVKYLLFDCMETLVDLHDWQGADEDARWAFEGSGLERLWESFAQFSAEYHDAKHNLDDQFHDREYPLSDRFGLMARRKFPTESTAFQDGVITRLQENFWQTYRSHCYVRPDVQRVLGKLQATYKLGVVSNFKVPGGVEELLTTNGIGHFFDFVISSINVGYRKPSPEIYRMALDRIGTPPSAVCFIGDDLRNDYLVPKALGMKTMLLDRYQRHLEIPERVADFAAILPYLF